MSEAVIQRFLGWLHHATICRALGVGEVTRRLPEAGCLRAPLATCGRCGRVLRCLLTVPPPPVSLEERALLAAQVRRVGDARTSSR